MPVSRGPDVTHAEMRGLGRIGWLPERIPRTPVPPGHDLRVIGESKIAHQALQRRWELGPDHMVDDRELARQCSWALDACWRVCAPYGQAGLA